MVLGIVCIAGAGMIAWADQTLDLFGFAYLYRGDTAGVYAADGDYLYVQVPKGIAVNTEDTDGYPISIFSQGVRMAYVVGTTLYITNVFVRDGVATTDLITNSCALGKAAADSFKIADTEGGAYSYTIGVGDWISGGDLCFTAGVVEVALDATVVTYRFPIPSRIAGSAVVIDRITVAGSFSADDFISEARLESSKAGTPATIATSAAAIKTSPAQWLPSDVTLDADTIYWLEYTITVGGGICALFETRVEYHTE